MAWHKRPASLALCVIWVVMTLSYSAVSVRIGARLVDSDISDTLSNIYNSITDEQNFLSDGAVVQDPILDLPASHSPLVDVVSRGRLSLPPLPSQQEQGTSFVETGATVKTDAAAAADASLAAANKILAQAHLETGIEHTQLAKMTTHVANQVTAHKAGFVAPTDVLPSMAPHDGLDGDGFGPLNNPGNYKGAQLDPVARLEAVVLPNADTLVPRYMGSDNPINDIRFTPVGSSSLPPLVGPQLGGPSHPVPGAKLVLPEHPDLPRVDHLGTPNGQPYSDDLPPLPPALPRLDLLPYVTRVPLPPQDTSPKPPDAKDAMIADAGNFGPLLLPPPTFDVTVVVPPVELSFDANPLLSIKDSNFRHFDQVRQQYIKQRAAALSVIDARRKQIDQLEKYVAEGEVLLAQKQSQITRWVADTRSKGARLLDIQKQKLANLRSTLRTLLAQQRQDSQKVNRFNFQLRKASIDFQLKMQKQAADNASQTQKKIQADIKAIEVKRKDLQNQMKQVNAQLNSNGHSGQSHTGESGAAEESSAE